jgi:hypothetical protein
MTISSIMKCAFSMLNIIYSHKLGQNLLFNCKLGIERRTIVSYIKFTLYQSWINNILGFLTTFSKYLSIVSTKLWINSSMLSSFYIFIIPWLLTTSSSLSIPMIKYRDAYRRYRTLYCLCSRNEHYSSSDETFLCCPYLAFCAWETLTDQFSFECDLLLYREAIIVFGDTRLALLVDHQDKLDHRLFVSLSPLLILIMISSSWLQIINFHFDVLCYYSQFIK